MSRTSSEVKDRPYHLDEVMFILWNLMYWGTDDLAVQDIATLTQRPPRDIKNFIKGLQDGVS